jgi:arylsulfatase A-like enzyme
MIVTMLTRRAFLGSSAAVLAAAQPARPNFLFLLVDDMGWRDLGCYGSTYYETPNIDRLAAQSVRFTNAYAACPVCSPTRASILTGKYPARLGLTDWIPGRKQWPTSRVVMPQFKQQLPLEEVTIAEALKPLGYATASIGKWHLGGAGFDPEKQGFDLNVAGTQRGSPESYFGPFDLPNLKGGTKDDYLNDRLTDAASTFLEQNRARPWFLYLPEFAVHIPEQAKAETIERFRRKADPNNPQKDPVYAAMIANLDENVGRLLRKLDDLGVSDRTVVTLMSDNGGVVYQGKRKETITSNAPLRAGKGHVYEGGIREPLIVRAPGITRAGTTCDVPVSSIDFFPTICELAGARAGQVDGRSMVPLLRGRSMRRDALYWHYPHYSDQGGEPAGAVRSGDYKLIEFYGDGRLELYNLAEDIGESQDLSKSDPRRTARLHEMLKRWRQSVNAAMPAPNPQYDPATADEGLTGARPEPASRR